MGERNMEEICFKPNPLLYKTLLHTSSRDNPYATSNVYAGKYLPSGELIAIKKYNVKDLCVRYILEIQKEIILMRCLSNPNILSILTSFVCDIQVVTIMPLMECGSCKDLIGKKFNIGIPEYFIATIVKDVVSALIFLHENGIIHRAVRASHILVNRYGNAKLTGFRYAYQYCDEQERNATVHDFPYNSAPNLKWLSPELLQQDVNGYNTSSDIYSLGITVCELANGIPPFENSKPKWTLMDKLSGTIPPLIDSTTFASWQVNNEGCHEFSENQLDTYSTRKFSENLHSFKDECCNKISSERPTALDLLDHAFFTNTTLFASDIKLPFIVIPDNYETSQQQNDNEMNCDTTKDQVDLPVTWNF